MTEPDNTLYDHSQPALTGVLITNLGTPDAPKAAQLRPYLRQFLSDPRVVEIPRALWWLILHGIILRIRPRRSAAAYSKIWTKEGSPLMVHTRNQASALQAVLHERLERPVVVDFAMRYGSPAIEDRIQALHDQGVRKLVVLPLYPQYSGPTTASTFDAIAADFTRRRWLPDLRFISHYHDYPPYISALCHSITAYWQAHGKPDKLLFSYHGEPRSYLDKGDPYYCECLKTTRLIVEQLGLAPSQYDTCFQSRFGKATWLQPYLDATLKSLPDAGVKSVQVICPGFAADCLETLEEIEVENRGYFTAAGGESFGYIPCLNDTPAHIDALAQLLIDQGL